MLTPMISDNSLPWMNVKRTSSFAPSQPSLLAGPLEQGMGGQILADLVGSCSFIFYHVHSCLFMFICVCSFLFIFDHVCSCLFKCVCFVSCVTCLQPAVCWAVSCEHLGFLRGTSYKYDG